jgi:hypothetical protein
MQDITIYLCESEVLGEVVYGKETVLPKTTVVYCHTKEIYERLLSECKARNLECKG